MGQPGANPAAVPDLTTTGLITALVFVIPLLLLGFFPNLLLDLVRPALAALHG
jgi:NADH:ubiquinone oxidoreductase subunit 4 (subunit M)